MNNAENKEIIINSNLIQQKQNENINKINLNKLSPRTIWGKVIIYLREHGFVAMHMACGDITDVELVAEKFIIKSTEQYLIDMLKREDNLKVLKDAFLSFGINEFVVQKKEKQIDKVKEDIQKLTQIFGNKLLVKNN